MFEVIKINSKPATLERYETIYRLYILDTIIGNKKVDEIKGIDIQRFYNEEFKRIQNENKIKSINKLLKYFFNYAVREDYILKNPCIGVAMPKEQNKIQKKIEPFEDKEIEKIKNYLNDSKSPYELLFLFAIVTGARQGEILALTKKDINLQSMEINISKNIKFVKIFNDDENFEYKMIEQETKTKNSNRIVPLPKKIYTKILNHYDYEEKKLKKLHKEFNEDSFVFTTYNGNPVESRNLLRIHQRMLKKLEIPYRNFHNFRHTFATKMFNLDVPLKTVSILLGHSDINITANTYTHIMPKQKLEAIEKLENIIDF